MRSSVKVTALPFFFDISFYDIILLLLLLVAVVVDLSSFSLLTTTTDNPPVDDWVKRLMKIMTHLESSGVGRCHRHLQIANVWQRCSPHSQCRLRCHFFFFFFFFFFLCISSGLIKSFQDGERFCNLADGFCWPSRPISEVWQRGRTAFSFVAAACIWPLEHFRAGGVD